MIESVKSGDVFCAGDHLLICGDLENLDVQRRVLEVGPYALVYSDPPWNVGLLKGFRTNANLPKKRLSFHKFLNKFSSLISEAQGPVFVEMGNATRFDLEGSLIRFGGRVTDRWAITYYRTKPCVLVRAVFGDDPFELSESPEGMDDEHTPKWVIARQSSPGDLVLDPCLGRGCTLRAAHELGRKLVGVELDPKRLAVGIAWLEAQGVEVMAA